jgi:hypothetical protein
LKPANELQALLSQRTWDKELILWRGLEKPLFDCLSPVKHVTIDLLDLFQPGDLQMDDEETKGALHSRLRQRLKAMPRGPDNRTVLVVKSIGLLARYRVGLNDFYDWFIGSHTVVVLLLEAAEDHTEWPEEVRLDTNQLFGYFAEPGMVKEVYAANA